MSQKEVVIIGGGLGGLATACLLGKNGYKVTVLEKNNQLGGRAGQYKAKGYTFDTGPSWLLMPDVFEHFFDLLGEKMGDHLELIRLNPSYRVFYQGYDKHIDIFPSLLDNKRTFETIEPGSGKQLENYLSHSKDTYETTIKRLAYRNYDSLFSLVRTAAYDTGRTGIFSSLDRHVRRYFKDERLQKLFTYPAVFLGTSPYDLPAAYCMLSHADFTQGVFYPKGGIYKIVEALVAIGKKHGVAYHTNTPVQKIITNTKQASGVLAAEKTWPADFVVSGCDRYHAENQLLGEPYRDHSNRYWRQRKTSPSALLLYLGVNRQYDSLQHHSLLFSKDWQHNFYQIFNRPALPDNPSLYVCTPSKTDSSVAPKGHENIFVLVPLPAGYRYSEQRLNTFTEAILQTMEKEMNLPGLRRHIVHQRSFANDDFAKTYNSFRGSGLGLAHNLLQTAFFRPHNKSHKLSNLYFVGADTHPGIGMPSVLISAELAYKRLTREKR